MAVTPNMVRGISENGGVVFCGLDSTDIVCQMKRYHDTSAVCSAALGRLLTAASMMGIMLKSDSDTMTIRIDGKGPAGKLIAVTDGTGCVRGYVENPHADFADRSDGKLNVGGVVGRDGNLTIVRDLGLKEPYVGMVPLVSGEIAEDITSYYATSEQIPTACALGVLVNADLSIQKAGGFLVQLLPGASDEEITQLENNLKSIQSVTKMLSEGLQPADIMQLVMKDFEPQVLDTHFVEYRCSCSLERTEKVLMSLGRKELETMAKEENIAEVCCQFCNKKYRVDLNTLLKRMK